ncbi:MAG: type II toxin-antitoxin system VapC family toxin [Planctomycetota bacterium]
MSYLLDTSVLVPAFVEIHPNHERAYRWLERAAAGDIEGALSMHSLAEAYCVLTTLPIKPRIAPALAWSVIRDSTPDLETVALTVDDYRRALQRMAELGLPGGVVYDALIARAAQKIDAEALLTFNVRHFRRVWPEGHDRILAP